MNRDIGIIVGPHCKNITVVDEIDAPKGKRQAYIDLLRLRQ
jgi:hypothetical protein